MFDEVDRGGAFSAKTGALEAAEIVCLVKGTDLSVP